MDRSRVPGQRCLMRDVRSGSMRKHRTARCVLVLDDCYLLAQHNNYRPETIGKWGLPGGRIDDGESPLAAVRREISEEFGLSLPEEIVEIGEWEYRRYWHKVFATNVSDETLKFDQDEILDARWYRFDEIENMDKNGELHTGFELPAIIRHKHGKIEPNGVENAIRCFDSRDIR